MPRHQLSFITALTLCSLYGGTLAGWERPDRWCLETIIIPEGSSRFQDLEISEMVDVWGTVVAPPERLQDLVDWIVDNGPAEVPHYEQNYWVCSTVLGVERLSSEGSSVVSGCEKHRIAVAILTELIDRYATDFAPKEREEAKKRLPSAIEAAVTAYEHW